MAGPVGVGLPLPSKEGAPWEHNGPLKSKGSLAPGLDGPWDTDPLLLPRPQEGADGRLGEAGALVGRRRRNRIWMRRRLADWSG